MSQHKFETSGEKLLWLACKVFLAVMYFILQITSLTGHGYWHWKESQHKGRGTSSQFTQSVNHKRTRSGGWISLVQVSAPSTLIPFVVLQDVHQACEKLCQLSPKDLFCRPGPTSIILESKAD